MTDEHGGAQSAVLHAYAYGWFYPAGPNNAPGFSASGYLILTSFTLVELMRFELTTSAVRLQRSPI